MKNSDIRDDFTARGLKKAKERLDVLQLPETERKAYERYQEDLHDQASFVLSPPMVRVNGKGSRKVSGLAN
ncbi:MAG: hypothetical protein HQL77_10430 [Magnetococcales bacterium]|nr:hypothetical protein [Magnetococcales bacterium]